MTRPLDATIAASAARTATGQSSLISLGAEAEHLSILVDVTAVTGTSPSCTFSVEWSNNGSTWATADTADSFTAITAISKKVKTFQAKGLYARLVWTITGTSPSFTFSATGVTAGSRAFA